MRPVAVVEFDPEAAMDEDDEAERVGRRQEQVETVAGLVAVAEGELRLSGLRHLIAIEPRGFCPCARPAIALRNVDPVCVGVVPVDDLVAHAALLFCSACPRHIALPASEKRNAGANLGG